MGLKGESGQNLQDAQLRPVDLTESGSLQADHGLWCVPVAIALCDSFCSAEGVLRTGITSTTCLSLT